MAAAGSREIVVAQLCDLFVFYAGTAVQCFLLPLLVNCVLRRFGLSTRSFFATFYLLCFRKRLVFRGGKKISPSKFLSLLSSAWQADNVAIFNEWATKSREAAIRPSLYSH